MKTTIMFVAALLPAVLLFLYVWKKDTKKEPFSQLVKAVLWGVAICVPVAFVELLIQRMLFGAGGEATTLFGTTVKAFFVAAVPEEAAKLFALWIVLRKNPYFDEHFDGIVYAVCVGLGFAAIENVAYIIGSEDWMSVAITRALLSVPGHYAFAVLMGYYYSLYHFVQPSRRNAICMLLVPVLAHGVYDAIAMSGSVNAILGGISFTLLVYFCIKMHKVAAQRLEWMIEKDKKNPISSI